MLTDNGSCYRSHTFRDVLGDIKHHTRPYRPQTNGKVERFHTPTITTAATQHSKVNHPLAAYLASQVSTARAGVRPRSAILAGEQRATHRKRVALRACDAMSHDCHLSRSH